MKKLFIVLLVLFSSLAFGQSLTSVTATLTDSSAQVWANAAWRAELVPPFGNPSPLNNQGHPPVGPQSGFANSGGTFTVSLDDNLVLQPTGSTWRFTLCPNASVPVCSISVQVIHGASMDLSGSLSADLTLPNVGVIPTISRAYKDSEANAGQGAIYWRTSDNTLRGCSGTCNGNNWVSIGSGGGGGITGLTAGTIPVATSPTSIGDGSLTDDGGGGLDLFGGVPNLSIHGSGSNEFEIDNIGTSGSVTNGILNAIRMRPNGNLRLDSYTGSVGRDIALVIVSDDGQVAALCEAAGIQDGCIEVDSTNTPFAFSQGAEINHSGGALWRGNSAGFTLVNTPDTTGSNYVYWPASKSGTVALATSDSSLTASSQVCTDSNSLLTTNSGTCGGGGTGTVAPYWRGAYDGSPYNWVQGSNGQFSTGTANQIKFVMVRIPTAIAVTTLNFYKLSNLAGSVSAFAYYDKTGTTKIFSWDNINTGSGGAGTMTHNLGSTFNLPAGEYLVASGSSITGTSPTTLDGYVTGGTNEPVEPWNTNGTVRTGVAANPMSGGAMPSSLGALSVSASVGLIVPSVTMEP